MTLKEVCLFNGDVAEAALVGIKDVLDQFGLSLEVGSEMDAYEVLYDLAGTIQVRVDRR